MSVRAIHVLRPTRLLQPRPRAVAFDLMTLALPSFGVWLLGFYSMFHCLLNIVAELLRFADRCVSSRFLTCGMRTGAMTAPHKRISVLVTEE